jgi:UDP-2,4-diacetamido-2,4,6-trideoxy-beta-L-altropyranose hydrolase
MKIVFRVDSSIDIGIGHVMRCRTLAKALIAQGAIVQFVCRAHAGNCIETLRTDGFTVTALAAPTRNTKPAEWEDYAVWLGTSQAHDAEETIAALDGPIDWMVVDHYGIDASWERGLRDYVDRIMVIDDLANRQHDCDLLLDQNYVHGMETRYRDKVPPVSRRLFGPTYALLRPEYAKQRRTRQQRDGEIRRVFVFFGGSDPENLTGHVLEALSDPALADIAVDAVVGPNNPHRETLAKQAEARTGITLHSPRPHLADLMAAADLAIGAGGSTTWERCCLGLPSLVVCTGDNQRPACEALASDGVVVYAGDYEQAVECLHAHLAELASEPERLQRIATAGRELVDGRGAERVAGAVTR